MLETLTTEKNTLQGQVNTLTTQNATLQTQLTTANETFETLTTEKNTLQGQVNTLTTQNATLQTQLTAANEALATLRIEKNTLQSQVNTLTTQNTILHTQLSTADGDLAVLQSQLQNYENTTEDLNNYIAGLFIEIEDLQTQLDNCSTTNVKQLRSSDIQIFPNPTTGIVNVSTASTIQVYSLQGALLYETFGTQVDLSTYPHGVYQLHINGEVVKVVKK